MDTDKALEEVGGIEKKLSTILPGEKPLDGLEARHEGGLEYSVISVRDGAPSYHYVQLGNEPSCTCPDFHGNRKSSFDGEYGEREPCAHMVKAMLAEQMEPERLAVRELINVTATVTEASSRARDAARNAEDTARELDTALVKARDHNAGETATESTQSDTSDGSSQQHSNEQSASDAAERLQEAFDNAVEGMAVEHNEGVVWVNKTPEAPDSLPGPGNVDVFEAFLQNPDQMEYVFDDHEYAGAAPGQYFSNMIRPENVDEYISEVLE